MSAWEFVLVRLRDDYNTTVTVPKSECPTIEAAKSRVWEEFDPALWRIGVERRTENGWLRTERVEIDGIDYTPLPKVVRYRIRLETWWHFACRRPLKVWIWMWRHGRLL